MCYDKGLMDQEDVYTQGAVMWRRKGVRGGGVCLYFPYI